MSAIVRERLDRSKETDLFYAVISFASRCLVEGDLTALRGVGFEPDDIRDLEGMSIADLQALSAARRSAVSVKLDRTAWTWHLKWVRHLRSRERLAMELIRLDAPKAMMGELFGYSDTDYTRRREALGIRTYAEGGRPPSAGKEAERKIWEMWVRLARAETLDQLVADDFWVPIARESRTGLRTVWNLVQRWANDAHMVAAWRREAAALPPPELAEFRSGVRTRHALDRDYAARSWLAEGDAPSASDLPE